MMITIDSPPALRLALACALWADLAEVVKVNDENALSRGRDASETSEEKALRAETLALLAGVDVPVALATLRADHALRDSAVAGMVVRGLRVVDAHGFGEGWQAMGTAPMVAPGAS